MHLAKSLGALLLLGSTPAFATLGIGLQVGTYHHLEIENGTGEYYIGRSSGSTDLKLSAGAQVFYEVPLFENAFIGGRGGFWRAPSFDNSPPLGVFDLDVWGRMVRPLDGWNVSAFGGLGVTRVNLNPDGGASLTGYGYHVIGGLMADFYFAGLPTYVSVAYELRGVGEMESPRDGGLEALSTGGALLSFGALL